MTMSPIRALVLALPVILSACVSAPQPHASRPVIGPPPPMARPVQQTILPQASPPLGLSQAIESLWRNFDGRVGIAIARSDASWMIGHRGTELFPQQSVSKLWVALTALDAVDRGRMSLEDAVTVRTSDRTVFNQPITQYIDSNEGFTTNIADLMRFSMQLSDNTANDVLLRKVGGPQAVRSFIANKGLGAIRFGPGERDLQAGTAGLVWQADYAKGNAFDVARAKLSPEVRQAAFDKYLADPVDGASPVAMARALIALKRGTLVSRASTEFLLTRMAESKTGPERLKGGVPPGWRFAHKTGTGQNYLGATAGYNDVALMTAPDGVTYAVVVMIGHTTSSIPARKALMQAISSTVAAYHQPIVGRAASR